MAKAEEIEIKRSSLKEDQDTKKEGSPAGNSLSKREPEKKWDEAEGQLAVDIYQTDSELVIQSAIAGVNPEALDVSVEGDLLTIKGERERPSEEEGDYFSQECYWGRFSRQIILPVEINPNQVDAALRKGVLTIRMPKILRGQKRKINIKG